MPSSPTPDEVREKLTRTIRMIRDQVHTQLSEWVENRDLTIDQANELLESISADLLTNEWDVVVHVTLRLEADSEDDAESNAIDILEAADRDGTFQDTYVDHVEKVRR